VTEASEVPNGFVGKNASVWTGDGAFQEFVVQTVDDHLVTAKRVLNVQGLCHFTLDSLVDLCRPSETHSDLGLSVCRSRLSFSQQCFNCYNNFGANTWETVQYGQFPAPGVGTGEMSVCQNNNYKRSCCISVTCPPSS
jgi:hypothetical protein